MRRIIELLLTAVGVYLLLMFVPQLPYHRIGKGTFPILSEISLFPESLAANSNMVYNPHGYWYGASAGPATLGIGGSVGVALYVPSPADQDVICEEKMFYILTNDSGVTAAAGINPVLGTTNSLYGGCPLFPYYAGAGGHPTVTAGYGNGITIAAGQSIIGEVARSDGLFNNAFGTCGSNAITSAAFSAGTTTLTLTGGNCIWNSTDACGGTPAGNAGGQYVQINGATGAPALNTPAGTVVGTNLYKITNSTATTIAFAGTAGQACSSNCGTAYSPSAIGTPPYTMPPGVDGVRTPAPQMFLANNSTVNIDYDLSGNTWCLPIAGSNLQPDGTAGLGAAATGGMNGVAF